METNDVTIHDETVLANYANTFATIDIMTLYY